MTVTVGFLHPGHWSACFANSLLDMMFYDAANNQNVVSNPHGLASQECGAGNIHSGRNKIATDVIGGNTEWLFMIDSDMGFAADTVDRLIEAADPTERPIVGGLAFACKSDGAGDLFARRYRACPTVYQMYETDTEVGFVPMFDYPRDQLVEVDGTGMACVLIHRSVLEKIYADHGDRWFNPIEVPKGQRVAPSSVRICRSASGPVPPASRSSFTPASRPPTTRVACSSMRALTTYSRR